MGKIRTPYRRLAMLVITILAAGTTASYLSLNCECSPGQQTIEYHGAPGTT